MSGFALLLLLQIMDKQDKIDAAIEPTFLESSCWKCGATFVVNRVSISPGSWAMKVKEVAVVA